MGRSKYRKRPLPDVKDKPPDISMGKPLMQDDQIKCEPTDIIGAPFLSDDSPMESKLTLLKRFYDKLTSSIKEQCDHWNLSQLCMCMELKTFLGMDKKIDTGYHRNIKNMSVQTGLEVSETAIKLLEKTESIFKDIASYDKILSKKQKRSLAKLEINIGHCHRHIYTWKAKWASLTMWTAVEPDNITYEVINEQVFEEVKEMPQKKHKTVDVYTVRYEVVNSLENWEICHSLRLSPISPIPVFEIHMDDFYWDCEFDYSLNEMEDSSNSLDIEEVWHYINEDLCLEYVDRHVTKDFEHITYKTRKNVKKKVKFKKKTKIKTCHRKYRKLKTPLVANNPNEPQEPSKRLHA